MCLEFTQLQNNSTNWTKRICCWLPCYQQGGLLGTKTVNDIWITWAVLQKCSSSGREWGIVPQGSQIAVLYYFVFCTICASLAFSRPNTNDQFCCTVCFSLVWHWKRYRFVSLVLYVASYHYCFEMQIFIVLQPCTLEGKEDQWEQNAQTQLTTFQSICRYQKTRMTLS